MYLDELLSISELSSLERSNRFQLAARALNISELERLIVGAFLTDHRPWPIQKLEHFTGYTRAAIRRHLRDLAVMGLAEDLPRQGWLLTALGRTVLILVFREVLGIAEGYTDRFSTDLLDLLEKINSEAVVRPFHLPRGPVV